MNLLKALIFPVMLLAAGCSGPAPEYISVSQVGKDAESLYADVVRETKSMEGKVVDGWFYGQYSRSLKSGYREVPVETKARFSVDYAKMLAEAGQDMEENWQSYVPYTKRHRFAVTWWSRHQTFIKENHWKQVLWAHESLMDASELFWRTLENKYPGRISSTAALTHDEEQKLVDKFKDSETGPERSLSSFVN